MLQASKVLQSRDEWKTKAIIRGNILRELKKSQKRSLEKIVALKLEKRKLEEHLSKKKQ